MQDTLQTTTTFPSRDSHHGIQGSGACIVVRSPDRQGLLGGLKRSSRGQIGAYAECVAGARAGVRAAVQHARELRPTRS